MSKHQREGGNLSGRAGFGDAATIEEACYAINRINWRTRRDRKTKDLISSVEREKAKITLSPSIDAWLKKEIP